MLAVQLREQLRVRCAVEPQEHGGEVVLFAAIFLYLTFLPGSLEPEIEQRLLLLAFFVGMGLLVILMCLVCTRRLSKYRVVRGCCGRVRRRAASAQPLRGKRLVQLMHIGHSADCSPS